jgi:hypothetical protein
VNLRGNILRLMSCFPQALQATAVLSEPHFLRRILFLTYSVVSVCVVQYGLPVPPDLACLWPSGATSAWRIGFPTPSKEIQCYTGGWARGRGRSLASWTRSATESLSVLLSYAEPPVRMCRSAFSKPRVLQHVPKYIMR